MRSMQAGSNAVTRVLLVAALALVACGGDSGMPDGGSQPTGPAVDVAGSTVTVDRASDVQADGIDQVTVAVTLVDTAGAPLVGKRVRLTVSGDGAVLGQPAATDAQGRTTGTLASVIAETKTVTASVVDAGGVPLAAHPTVEFVPGAAARLAFLVPPSTARAATAITPAVQVAIVAANGRPLAAEGKITLALGTNPAGGTLSGTRSADAVDGVATFADLAINKAGYGYTLVASSPGLTSATSGGFEVTAGAPARLAFLTQPTNATAGSPIAPAPRVALLDAQGNVITAAGTAVTVALGAHAGTATLSGTKTVNAVAGVATFAGLAIDKVDTGYTLAATATGYAGAMSAAFDVATGAASAGASSVVADPASVVADGTATTTITVTIKDASGNPVAERAVSLSVSGEDNDLSAAEGTTDADGVFTATLASTKAEGKTVTVTAGDLTLTATVTFVADAADAAKSDVAASPSSVLADGTATTTITVTAKDANGNLAAGQAVSLSVSGSDNTLSAMDGVTDADGVFTATLASTKAETKVITATLDGLALMTMVEFVGGPAVQAGSQLGVAPARLLADGSSTATITVTLVDANGNPAAGQAVSLSVSGSGNTLTPASGTAGADGVYTATLASTEAGEKTITATAGEVTLTASVTFIPGVCFAPQTTYAVGSSPWPIASADFNGDGKADLVTANYASSDVSVLFGNGDGSFQAQAHYGISYARGVTTGDFDEDGHVDVAAADYSGGVSVLLNNGDGGFQAAVGYPGGKLSESIASADFDEDGHIDLVVADYNGGNASVLLGNGDGSFQAPANHAAGEYPYAVATGDFDGDGHADLVVPNYYAGAVSVLLGDGAGGFGAPTGYAAGSFPRSITVGDLDGDGHADLMVVGTYGSLNVLRGEGDGSFGAPVAYSTGGTPLAGAVGDLNGDGHLDLALPNSDGVLAWVGLGDGDFLGPVGFPAGSTAWAPVVADLNGDGRPDVAVTNSGSNDVGVLLSVPCGG